MKTTTVRSSIATALAVAGLALCTAAQASTFSITSSTSGTNTTFTIRRSGEGTNSAERVCYRAVSRSALSGFHFVDKFGNGTLVFSAGETSRQIQITEKTAAQINDARFTYYQSGGATGSSRKYVFEVVDEGGFSLASTERTISYDSSKSVSSSAFNANSVTVSSGEITVTDQNFIQAYHAVPLNSYFSSSIPKDYLSASGARICMTLDFQAAEVSDGYQYVQILTNNTVTCDDSADKGNPGTPALSCYLAGFEHKKDSKDTTYKKYSFPVTSYGDACGAVTKPWSDLGNDIGDLCQQRFKSGCRATDGRLAVLPSISTLGIRFDASGSDNDDWKAKSVVANLQAVPAGPSLLAIPVVTPAPVCKGTVVSISLPFNEIVTVTGTPTLSTTWGNLSYSAGSGANVLTFVGTVTAAAGTQLRLTGLSGGTVKGLTGTSFAWPGTAAVSGRTVDSFPTPPLEAATGAYMLSMPAHLRWFADQLATTPNTSAALAADIDLSASGTFPAMGGANGFAGTFDGRGHSLSSLSVSSSNTPVRVGLFGQIAAQGVVTNLVLTNATVTASANPALAGAVCGRNLGTIALCSVFGSHVTTGPYDVVAAGTALGGVCGENAGTVRACRVIDPLDVNSFVLYNRVKNDAVGGIVGTNAVSGTIEGCLFYARYNEATQESITRGAVCGANAGTVRNCVGVHNDHNYFSGVVGSNSGTTNNVQFLNAGTPFTGGAACYALNGGVTDGMQPWYQTIGVDSLPQFSGGTVYRHDSVYKNSDHIWGAVTFAPSSDFSNGVWSVVCSVGGETAAVATNGTAEVTAQPTCTSPGEIIWTYVPPANDHGFAATNVVQHAPAALGHAWNEPSWSWNVDDYTSATATFHCSRCGVDDTVAATVTRIVDGTNIVSTATVTHHGETFTDTVSVSTTPWKALQVRLDLGGTVTLIDNVAAIDVDETLTVTNAVTLDLNGCTLDANGKFSVITIASGGNLTLTNSVPSSGAITGGTADLGGGVYVEEDGMFTMTGGAISGNTAYSCGGGVYVGWRCAFTMTGGEISGNTASCGGGVYESRGTFTVSGSPSVFGNTNSVGVANNVHLTFGHTIALGGLSSGASIGVTTEAAPTVTTLVTFATGASAGDKEYFFSDRSAFVVDAADGELRLRKPPTPWDLLQEQLDAGGTVTLTSDVTAIDADATLTVTNAVTLDLNGHTIDAAGLFRVIQILEGGNLTLTNSVPSSGAITGGTADFGGGVYVDYSGSFTMTGGEISGNTANYGGGVCVYGTFTMTGGEISGNTADVDGGGVELVGNKFTMSGGEISGNSAGRNGGGMDAYVGTSTMTAGEISGNVADCGGGVFVYASAFTVSGTPVVFGNTNSVGAANNVDLRSEYTITVDGLSAGASIGVTTATAPAESSPVTFASGASAGDKARFFSDVSGFVVDRVNDELFLRLATPWELLQAQLNAGGTVTLTNDVTAADIDESLTVSTTVTLDLNGHTLTHNGNGQVLSVETGGDLTLTNSLSAGAVTGGGDHGVSVGSNAVFRLQDGAISGNTANMRGGGVYVDWFGAFEMSGGSITNNAVQDGNGSGGGVYVVTGGMFTMTGGEISGNTATHDGGGVSVDGGTFTMTDGEISGNTVYWYGGGVCVYGDGMFTMTGGEISGNTGNYGGGVFAFDAFTMTGGEISGNSASYGGGGVYVSNDGTFTVSGSSVVAGNTNSVGTANNVYLTFGDTIAVDGLSAGACLGVTTVATPTESSPVAFATGAATGDGRYFTSDNPVFAIDAANDVLNLVKPATTPWNSLQAQLDAGGTVTLMSNVAATDGDATLMVTNAVTLDLNGCTLDANSKFSVIKIASGGNLTLTNSFEGAGVITGGTNYFGGGGVYVDTDGTFTMTGGKISGNTARYGGGVYVYSGTFMKTGGEISGNTASWGGGVYVTDRGAFTMTGGEISGNTADWDGGGVCMSNNGTFTMTGGEISGNTSSIDQGGGVYVYSGTFTMTRGEISGNTAPNGGGVYLHGGAFTMSGGVISDNNTVSHGGGVYVNDRGAFTVSGSPAVIGNTNSVGAANNVYLLSQNTITVDGLSAGASIGITTFDTPGAFAPVTFATGASAGDAAYFSSDDPVFVVDAANGELRLRKPSTPWIQLQAQLNAGGTVTLTNDVAAIDSDETLTVTNAVVLDLNGHTLTHNGQGEVFSVRSGGVLTLTNSLAAGTVTGGDHGVYVGSNAVFRLQGGAIAGNASDLAGGGVFVDRFGSFEMSGGSITNNAVNGGDYVGGGVHVVTNGTFTMTGGAISGNAARAGGGVYVDKGGTFALSGGAISGNTASWGGGVRMDECCAFTMTGGAVSGNTAEWGGGLFVDEYCAFTMSGGEISGNTASWGGGVYAYSTFTVSGSPVICGNKESVGTANNVYLRSGCTITVDGLSKGAFLGVDTANVPHGDVTITIATGASAGDAAYFFNDDYRYHVEQDGSTVVLVAGSPAVFKDPQDQEIAEPAVVSWLLANRFSQGDIYALGHDGAATDRLYECFLVNCNFRVQDAGGALSLTGIAVTNGVVAVSVQLVRTAPLGAINGGLNLYGTSDLALGFDGGQIEKESISFVAEDDPCFDTEKTTGSVTQSVTATFDVSHVTDKFFKAVIMDDSLDEPDPFPEEPNPDDPDPNAPEE